MFGLDVRQKQSCYEKKKCTRNSTYVTTRFLIGFSREAELPLQSVTTVANQKPLEI